MVKSPLLLGIDIGTSKVAAVLLDGNRNLLAVHSLPHQADVKSSPGYAEQDIDRLLATVKTVVTSLPGELRAKVEGVGVTGQMHGVILLDDQLRPLSNLITWQDTRCRQDQFLERLNQRTGHHLFSGYGCATLAWLSERHLIPKQATCAATIHDLFVARLCDLSSPLTDPTDAASWGLFDLHSQNWHFKACQAAGIPQRLLPHVVPSHTQAGVVSQTMAKSLGIPEGVPVAVAIGDNQASLLAVLEEPEHDLALNLGTGGQLSAVLKHTPKIADSEINSKFEYRPFPGSKFVAVASSLCGGSAWTWLANTIDSWLCDLNLPRLEQNELFKRLNELGLACEADITVRPHFLGERYDESLRASIHNIHMNNFDLGTLARSLAHGIVTNLKSMLPPTVFKNRTRIVGSGNALRLNPLLQKVAEDVFELPLEMNDLQEEAACGAALHAVSMLQ